MPENEDKLPDFDELDSLPSDPADAEPSVEGDLGALDSAETTSAEPEAGEPEAGEPEAGEDDLLDLETDGDLEDETEQGEAEDDSEEKKGGILAALAGASPYTVALGLALAAIVIGTLFLLLELSRYDFDFKATKAKQMVRMTPAIQSGPANTAVAAWPTGVQFSSKAEGDTPANGSPWMT